MATILCDMFVHVRQLWYIGVVATSIYQAARSVEYKITMSALVMWLISPKTDHFQLYITGSRTKRTVSMCSNVMSAKYFDAATGI